MRTARIARVATLGLFLVAALPACSSETTRPDGQVGLLPVGSPAPDVTGEDAAGNVVKLSDQRGKLSVVYFYPKDNTPGCTTQACAFRDAWDRLNEAGIVVFGVSRDSAESHREFRKDHKLPFPLVADESGDVMKAYGVPSKFVVMTARVTFLVDGDGKIAHVWPNVDPAVDAKNVLDAAAAMKGAPPAG